MATQGIDEIAPGTTLGGKFLVTRTIGVGGMGAVYEVQHTITRHRRALKLLHTEVREKHPDIVRRFLREASVAGTLGDPHIVETFDAGELPSGEPYLLMELLEGEPLSSRIRRGKLSIAECAGIAMQLCEAVSVAHARGIVHRDLKPENVFLCSSSKATPRSDRGVPFVKVLDFGISKFDESLLGTSGAAATHEGIALGTPYYMPPEQVRGLKDIDARADVYALGVILYESLTGRRPFEADSMPHLVVLIHEGKPTPIRMLRAETPEALEAIVMRAMNPNREARIATAKELATLLEPFLSTPDPGLDQTAIASTERAPSPPSARASHSHAQEALAATALSAEQAVVAHSTVGMSSTNAPETALPRAARGMLLPVALGLAVVIGGAGWMLRKQINPETPTHEPASEKSASSIPPTPAPSSSSPTASSSSASPSSAPSSASSSSVGTIPSAPPTIAAVPKPSATAPGVKPPGSVTSASSTKPVAPTGSGSSKVKTGGLAGSMDDP
jgi:serine/threonine protein kinase